MFEKLEKYEGIYFKILCIALFFAGMGLVRYSRNPFFIATFIVFVLEVAFYYAIHYQSENNIAKLIFHSFDIREITLFLGMSLYYLARYWYYSDHSDYKGPIIWAVTHVMFYIIGKFAILNKKEETDKRAEWMILSFGIALMIHNLLNIAKFYMDEPEVSRATRQWRCFWVPAEYVTSATFFEYYPLVIIGLVVWATITIKKHYICSLFIIMTGVISSFWFYIETHSKLCMAELLLIVLMSCAILLIDYCLKGQICIKQKRVVFIMFGVVTSLAFICGIIFYNNIWGLRDIYDSSPFGRDGGILENIRFKMQWMCILDLKKYPFGNNHTVYVEWFGNTTHGSWTDIAMCGGIIPFIFMIIFFIYLIIDIFLILTSKKIETSVKLLVIMPFIAVWTYSFTEVMPEFFSWHAIMFFAGIIRAINLNYNYYGRNVLYEKD